jgi:ribosome-associated toxin RatA of RatAB toxin-antitoxin module
MHTENSVLIRADLATIYRLAATVEDWPTILPHYRRVRVLRDDGDRRLVEMAAWRDAIPVWWQAEQRRAPDIPRITFRHVRGVTAGMAVEWRFEPTDDGVRVSILHDLDLRWPLIGRLVGERVIGPVFVANIAGKTLARIKALAEAATLAGPAGTDRARGDHADARSNPT